MPPTSSPTFKLEIDDDLCHHCRHCLASDDCRGNAFVRFDPADTPFIDMSKCWGCLKCVVACPFEAIIRSDYG